MMEARVWYRAFDGTLFNDYINKRLTGYEQARLDVEQGRICRYDSLDDFIKEIENG